MHALQVGQLCRRPRAAAPCAAQAHPWRRHHRRHCWRQRDGWAVHAHLYPAEHAEEMQARP